MKTWIKKTSNGISESYALPIKLICGPPKSRETIPFKKLKFLGRDENRTRNSRTTSYIDHICICADAEFGFEYGQVGFPEVIRGGRGRTSSARPTQNRGHVIRYQWFRSLKTWQITTRETTYLIPNCIPYSSTEVLFGIKPFEFGACPRSMYSRLMDLFLNLF